MYTVLDVFAALAGVTLVLSLLVALKIIFW